MFIRILCAFLTILLLQVCRPNKLKVDTSDIDLELTIKRFDQELFSLKEKGIQKVNELKAQHPEFFKLYSYQVIKLGDPNDPDYAKFLSKFLNDTVISEVYAKCQEVFPDLQLQEKALIKAFKHFKYHFPSRPIPQIYAHVSGFNQSVIVAEDILSVSLDKYLGEDCEFYARLQTPVYARYKMTPKRMPFDVILAFALTEFEFDNTKDNVLSNMIYHGKIRYFMQALNPEASEVDIMGYKPEQMKWCRENEENMWGYIIEQKHLFSSEYKLIMRYVNEGPFTRGMPKESPSRTGIWLGWQIVKSYMENHRKVDLPALMAENNYEKILRESGYQP